MTNKMTFDSLFSLGHIIKEDDLFQHNHFSDFLDLYDANFIQFKKMPSLAEFIAIENYLTVFHQNNGQEHLKFRFPENCSFSEELKDYIGNNNYTSDILEFFILEKDNFPKLPLNHLIEVKVVSSDTLDDLLKLRYDVNKEYGTDYAKRKNNLIVEKLKDEKLTFLIAYYENQPAGCLNLIETSSTLEIDDLFVDPTFRNKKIASYLQQKTIQLSNEKSIILLADANDTPRNMYLKQGYQLQGERYDIFKML